jgi:transcription elongation factor Elf1
LTIKQKDRVSGLFLGILNFVKRKEYQMNKRACPHCHCSKTVKYGKQHSHQRYLCKDCRKTFSTAPRPCKRNTNIQSDFMDHKQSVKLLAVKYQLHPNTIRQIVHQITVQPIVQQPRPVSVIMDVTYWGRSSGLLAVIDPNATAQENLVLYYCFIDHTETTADYLVATDTILAMGYTIISATIDGRRGVKEMLESKAIPVQYCQFHQLQTINQCLTKNPILPPHKELRDIALTLTSSSQPVFAARLDAWYLKYAIWLRERYTDEHGRLRYRHARCRRAYFSLKRNLPNLFTYQLPELQEWSKTGTRTRNTTSPLDGRFAVLKDKLKAHRGITHKLKVTMLCNFLSEATGRENN